MGRFEAETLGPELGSGPSPAGTQELVRLRRSTRARRLRLVVKPDGIELVLPQGVALGEARAFYHQHRLWALSTLAEVQQRRASLGLERRCVFESDHIPYRGAHQPVRVVERPGALGRFQFDPSSGFVFECAPGLVLSESSLRAALFQALRHRIHAEVINEAANLGASLKLYPRQVRIKRLKSRWGSCGPKGDINLNWALIFAPAEVLRYVVLHELCHLRHRNHSGDFWALVGSQMPDWRVQRHWLRVEGPALLARFG